MQFRRPAVIALAVVVLITTACSSKDDIASDFPRPSRAFCRAAARYDEAITSKPISIARHVALSKAMAQAAPSDTRRDATLVWRAYEKLQAGDRSVVDDEKVTAAIKHVNRRATQDCGWFTRQGL